MESLSVKDYFIKYLSNNDIRYQLVGNVIQFSRFGVEISFRSYSDPNYFRMLVEFEYDGTEDISNWTSFVSREVRIVKAYSLEGNRVILSAEQYVFSDGGIFLLFGKMIDLLLHVRLDLVRRNQHAI